MSALTLQVVSIDAAPIGQPITCAFDATGGSIGRDETNLLALPDKHRRVSRLHATISFPGGMPTITNSSTSLPLSVGEQQLDGGDSMPIAQGALIEIGPYILQAHLGALANKAAASPATFTFTQDPTPTRLPDYPVAFAPAFPTHTPTPTPTPTPAPVPLPGNSIPPDPPTRRPMAGGAIDHNRASLQHKASNSPPVASLLPDSFGADLGIFMSPPPNPATAAAAATLYAAPSRPAFSIAPPAASANVDPFADLLAGIGGAPVPAAQSTASPHALAVMPIAAPIRAGISADPLAAFGLGPTPSADAFASFSGAGESHFGGASSLQTSAALDPFHMPSSVSRNSADPLAGLLGSTSASAAYGHQAVAAPSIDSLFLQTDPASAFAGSSSSDGSLLGFPPSGHSSAGSLDALIRSDAGSDPMALFAASDFAPDPLARPMRDDRVEVGSAFTPPLAVTVAAPVFAQLPPAAAIPTDFADWGALSASPPATPTVAFAFSAPAPTPLAPTPTLPPVASPVLSSAVAAPSVATDTLTDAFLRGAGLPPNALPHGLTPEIMTVVGSLLRSATAGAVDMLAARAATKREVQASVTIISVQANNPLKFLPNADTALLQLLGKKMPGFMRADVAMRDAFDDLRAHEVGVIAGTRAALTEVLGKFDPAILGDKLTRGSVLESLIPSARKAKLWDQYLERYLQIRREAEDDFQSIFGRAFVQAYERETARIKGESPMAGGE